MFIRYVLIYLHGEKKKFECTYEYDKIIIIVNINIKLKHDTHTHFTAKCVVHSLIVLIFYYFFYGPILRSRD